MGETRDYYADLELPPTADITEIKKQFRKLALKYHPDRNPGREQEVNAQFQIIQCAHEVLGDATEKAKYDASYSGKTSRYPTASGRKGNPWSEAAQNFPPPPRRNPPGGKPASSGGGAQRWSSRFSAGVPPTAKQYTTADPETKKNAAKAFDTMRKSQAKKPQAKPEPPPPPPRTQTGRERAEASFGTRKTSQASRPPPTESDPSYRKPAPRYYEVGSQPRPPMPDPLSQFRDNAAQSDARYSSQYTTHGGEKINPFEGTHRTPSTRSTRETAEDPTRRSRADDLNSGSAGAYAKPAFQQQAHRSGSADSTRAQPESESMYANPPRTYQSKTSTSLSSQSKHAMPSFYFGSLSSVYNPQPGNLASSGCPAIPPESPQFEKQLQNLLARLIDAHDPNPLLSSNDPNVPRREFADKDCARSFNIKVDDDTFNNSDNSRSSSRPRPAHQSSFDKTNVDGINTKFSKEFAKNLWNFTAGSPTSDKPGAQQYYPESPNSKQSNAPYSDAAGAAEPSAHETGFNPGGWSDKFGPQTFVPQQAPAGAPSPTRTSRTNSRKTKPAKSNANNPIVIDDSDDDVLYAWPGRKTQGEGQSTDSPQEMDIDTPPAVPPRPPASARGIYVEPTRPEWRSDDAQPAAENSAPASHLGTPSAAHVGGSEDSAEFIASFDDLKNVPPFAQQKAGLKSFADLKDNLPFDSKASDEVPLQIPKVQPLVFPTPPIAPRPPPTVAIESVTPSDSSWNKYLDDFGMYLQEWELFNTQVVDHFATRNAHIRRDRESKGYAFLGSRSENEIQEYISCVQQDNDVRRRWNAACEDHEERFREFMAFRSRMKKKKNGQ
ncbi:Heat shock protein DnaJ [Akanthomyces lecanii RCEF 1005]|uniref:Heat shock protein DnaJ n=1 Tax=Akanthomyces lecanii RCEF 1005 TaxID=1081108 RepID=A0A162KN57_CORDF|nr:Heat shock protein DnaJ [Akanthomyces lecanii RCEF 1005]